MQRDGSLQNGGAITDTYSPPKLPHYQPYVYVTRFLFSLSNFVYSPSALSQRNSRPVEKSKAKGIHIKQSFLHYITCLILGIFIGFTPFSSFDVSKNLVTKQKAFLFVNDVVADKSHKSIDSVKKETTALKAVQPLQNDSLEIMAKGEYFNIMGLSPRNLLIIVTPAHERPFQAYYLNRLAHTLRAVRPPLLWIVVEMHSQSIETAKILSNTGVMYRHLVCNKNVTSMKSKEVFQRNVALSHIEKHKLDGIVHFADDDRMYSVEIFDQMRQISRFGAWPVAIMSESKNKVVFEGPVCNGSNIIGWHTYQRNKLYRRFHVDMSGFAFNSTLLWDPARWHRPTLEAIRLLDKARGLQETTFIEQMMEDESQMEGFPNGCSKIMVWHLHLEASQLFYPKAWSTEKNLEVVGPLNL